MIRHVSLLTWVDDVTPDQVQAVTDGLRALPPLIPELRDYRVGPDLGIDDNTANFVVIADFDDADGYRAYRDHPAHRAVGAEHILPILAARRAAQYTL